MLVGQTAVPTARSGDPSANSWPEVMLAVIAEAVSVRLR